MGILKDNYTCEISILGLFCMCVQWLDWMDYPVIFSRYCAIGEVL